MQQNRATLMAQSRPAADFKQAIGALDQAQSADGAKESINAPRAPQKPKQRSRRKNTAQEDEDSAKRRCVSSACVACRYVTVICATRPSVECCHYPCATTRTAVGSCRFYVRRKDYTPRLTHDLSIVGSVNPNAMESLHPARPAPKSTAPSASTTPTQIIGGKASIRGT